MRASTILCSLSFTGPLVCSSPPQAQAGPSPSRDLLRLLGHSLAADSAADRRQRRLGLQIELISEGGEFIPTTRYEQVRKERAAQGTDWPSAANLTRSYGHWLVAVKAANRFWFGGGRERVSDSHAHARGTQHS